jgi:hypothetical protein
MTPKVKWLLCADNSQHGSCVCQSAIADAGEFASDASLGVRYRITGAHPSNPLPTKTKITMKVYELHLPDFGNYLKWQLFLAT